MDRDTSAPPGAVPWAAAIAALRAEFTRAWTEAQNKQLRFWVAPVELTAEAALICPEKGTMAIQLVAAGTGR